MKENNQNQNAGDNSTQIQAKNIENFYNGINEQDVRMIVKDEINIALKENYIVSKDVARNRLNDFSEIFLPKIVKANLIDCFRDPAIQMFFRSVEKTAICKDRHNCYEILAEMLIHRVNRKEDYTTVAATNKAIEIVDKISDEALLFLTIFLCVDSFIPTSGNIKIGLQVLDNLYQHLLGSKEIPYNSRIIDNLEIVGAVRRESLLSYKTFDEIFSNELEGYACAGIDKNSENYQKAKELLDKIKISENSIFSDSLIENHTRINVVNRDKLNNILVSTKQNFVNDILNKIYNLYDKLPENINKAKNNFCNIVKDYPNILKVKNWWDNNIINCGVCITPIGKVLAHTNAKCIDNNIPNLD